MSRRGRAGAVWQPAHPPAVVAEDGAVYACGEGLDGRLGLATSSRGGG